MLKGIRIIDFSVYLPGPYATMRLADLGAEVIKVEPPSGDPARTTGRELYIANNRNKKSVCLNLKEREGQEIAIELVCNADVVVESFRPGVMERLGLDYESIRKRKPNIIYCSLSGFGQNSVMSTLGSHDLNYMALSGVLSQLKDSEGRPVHPTTTFADLIGGISANESILAAIYQREKTGKGQYLDVSLTDSMIALMGNHVLIEKETGHGHGVQLLGGEIINYAIYETSDNRFISLAALEKKFWDNFCNGVDRSEWLASYLSKAVPDNPIYQEVKALFKSRSLAEWTKFSLEVDCCMAPILEAGEISEHPYVKERNLITIIKGLTYVKTQPVCSLEQPSPPPEMGEHTPEILHSVLGININNKGS
ncbi:CaiB/BaiF CoA transferase family protein [Calidifontibacillus oryziterrae]|uniref:CaiB/BaiF CoA transferase family protein n=1 Tax=Calidifontibacillus oryziterrae TaxID=1191699 RepID=UPI0002E9F378|nr:CoA transferase [Calidifontibacillus oryziterrae]